MALLDTFKQGIIELLDHPDRLWVVNIRSASGQNDTFVVDESSFSTKLQWMKRKGYSETMLEKVDAMSRSKVLEFDLGRCTHHIVRVK